MSHGTSRNLPDKEVGKWSSEERVGHVHRPGSVRQDVLGHWKRSSLKPVVDREKKEIKLKVPSRLDGEGPGYGIWPLS